MRTRSFWLFLPSLLLPLPVFAQSAPASTPTTVAPAPVSAMDSTSSAETLTLSLQDAIRLGLEKSTDLKANAAAIQGAQAKVEQAKDSRYPIFSVGGNLQQYTADQVVCTADPNSPPPANSCVSDGGVIPDLKIRDATTFGGQATVAMPLTAQYALKKREESEQLNLGAAEVGRELSKREVIWQVEQAYLQLLKAQAFADAANASVDLAKAQVERVKRYVEVGVLAKNDLLRAELGLSQAEQGKIQADTGVMLAEGSLALSMGVDPNTHIIPTDKDFGKQLTFGFSLEDATKSALEKRLEFDQVNSQLQATQKLAEAAKINTYPQLSALVTYQYSSGSAFAGSSNFFAGLNMSWNVWDWGLVQDQIDIANAGVAQISAQKDKLSLGILLDVRSRYLSLKTSEASLVVAAKSIESAKENLRITESRFDAKAATTTDLLDAQVLLTRAVITEISSRYDYYSAIAGLYKAMGEDFSGIYTSTASLK